MDWAWPSPRETLNAVLSAGADFSRDSSADGQSPTAIAIILTKARFELRAFSTSQISSRFDHSRAASASPAISQSVRRAFQNMV
jgi:hypothetical protein